MSFGVVEMCSQGGGEVPFWGVEMCQIWGVEMCWDEVNYDLQVQAAWHLLQQLHGEHRSWLSASTDKRSPEERVLIG